MTNTNGLLEYVMSSSTGWRGPVPDAHTLAFLLLAERWGQRDQAVRMILDARREGLRWQITTQRSWQTKVSRRPQRGRHHDSWRIREKYVRIHRSSLETGSRDGMRP
jgi:hypothetical protein